jgi:hypothetical protein
MTPRELVEATDVFQSVEFPEDFPLESVRFDKRNYGEEYDEYSWTAKGRGNWHYITPFGRVTGTVATFKTLKGAKRNFLKQYSHYFKAGAS